MNKLFTIIGFLLIALILVACGDEPAPELKTYTVTFDVDGGTSVSNKTVNEGSTLGTLPTTTKEDFDFAGWYTNSAKTEEATSSTVVNSNMTIYAKWTNKVNVYTITFVTNSPEGTVTRKVNEGTLFSDFPTPNKANHEFKGWYLEDEFTGNSVNSIEVTSDLTLYANWQYITPTYTLTFDVDGGSAVNAITVDEDMSINKPQDPTKEGFKFAGWTTNLSTKVEVQWPITMTSNLKIYAIWNEQVAIGQYLSSLLNTYKFKPQDILPTHMQAGGVLKTQAQLNSNYATFVNTNQIAFGGYGEQWQMVLDNLEQAETLFTVLSVIDTISSASVVAFNNYLDSNPDDTSNYEFKQGIYNVYISLEGEVLSYVVDYTANIPVFGEQTVQIALNYNVVTSDKDGRIQIGDANSVKYQVFEDGFTIASKYLGFRTSYIEVTEDENGYINGSIHEHMTVAGKSISSAAQFSVDDTYVSVVGNKAGAIIGFSGTIVELYQKSTGKLLGYEVKETLSSIQYNTLWFNLDSQTGITNIKYETDAETQIKEVYVNNGTTPFKTKSFGGFTLKTASRRYDIEFRTQYFYVMENDVLTKVSKEVPMLFIQVEKYDELSADIISQNSNISSFSLNITSGLKSRIESDYASLIPIFDTQKDEMNYEQISAYIGSKVVVN
ncbi:InlB B-repeat-containing protein [Acholeplasma laidlawii]|uniref:InlB B-repeat-containing protein n=1 Tax=Acholeplasma laidlawii TaxID=2148 RepID=UPI00084BF9B9|nr:InlB B-repeat-containing protein [Acholeplasma laidlawii]OED59264.1 hypothetical protein BHS12_04645 [Acholeplasma laidlawii]